MSQRGIDAPVEPEAMTLKEAAQYLHRHYTTVYRFVHTGELPAFRLSKDWRVKRADLEDHGPRWERGRNRTQAQTQVETLITVASDGSEIKKGHGRRPGRKTHTAPPTGLNEAEVMTVKQAADHLSCHYNTVLRMVKAGRLPGFQLGGGWRLRRSDIERWIDDGRVENAPVRERT